MLTAKQENFCINIINGMTQADAYRNAYPGTKMSDKTIYEQSSKMMNNPKIYTRIKELREEVANSEIMTAKERLKWLSSVIRDNEEKMSVRLSASDQMNKMQGEYVQKIEGSLNVTKLEDVL